MDAIILKRDIKPRIFNGHPWVYSNEIEKVIGNPSDGDVVNVFTSSKQFVGKGFFNSKSTIRVRILTRKNEKIDESFFRSRLKKALERRFQYLKREAFRVVHAEADGLPGLIIDKYGKYLVIQTNSLGMEKSKSFVVDSLIEFFEPEGIFLKNDSPTLKKEGIETVKEWIYGKGPEIIEFSINGLKMYADIMQGQKTGFFLDQVENSKLISNYSKGKKCLDVFSYHGNFALQMLNGGAVQVDLVDISKRALRIAERILRDNGFDNFFLIESNAFDFLKRLDLNGEKYDLISLDPPPFARSRSTVKNALKGYKEINLRAMKILRNNGILATSSCSQSVSREEFERTIYSAAMDTKKRITILHRGGQPIDHPTVMNILETDYLKFYILMVEDLN